MPPEQRLFPPVTVRSRLMLEIASELSGTPDWPYKQTRLQMRDQVSDTWSFSLFASDSPEAIEEVGRGDAQVAIVNPGAILALAQFGSGPFQEPFDLRAITVIASYDQLAFAVTDKSGLKSLEDIRDQRYPLKVSLRGQRDHSVHLVVNEVLSAVGFSVDDLLSWGGKVVHHPGVNDILDKVDEAARGEIDAIFDEGVGAWANKALDAGMHILPLDESLILEMEALGFQRGTMTRQEYPGLPADVETLDFSGFTIYTRADTPDQVIRGFCAALEARKDRIPRDSGEGPLPLDRMCRNTPEGPLLIALHPAAEQFWREMGYLP